LVETGPVTFFGQSDGLKIRSSVIRAEKKVYRIGSRGRSRSLESREPPRSNPRQPSPSFIPTTIQLLSMFHFRFYKVYNYILLQLTCSFSLLAKKVLSVIQRCL